MNLLILGVLTSCFFGTYAIAKGRFFPLGPTYERDHPTCRILFGIRVFTRFFSCIDNYDFHKSTQSPFSIPLKLL